jgi:beta-lactamase superfamily II metal-dependent hydrolase
MSDPSPSTAGRLVVHILDVGQGDGIYIEFPNGKNMLVDLGSTKNKDLTSGDVFKFFQNHTRFGTPGETLDYLIVTHGDRDHYNLIPEFLKKFDVNVGTLFYGGVDKHYKMKGALSAMKERADDVLIYGDAGPHSLADASVFGGVEVIVLAVDAPTVNKAEAWVHNTPSVVLQLVYGGNSIILSGDATIDTEKYILETMDARIQQQQDEEMASENEDEDVGMDIDDDDDVVDHPLRSLVLKVGHHGSLRTSVRPEWIETVAPRYAFISSDRSGWSGTRQESRDERRSGYKLTGYRLPQQICIDVIEDNTDLAEDCVRHPYVADYNPADYQPGTYAHVDRAYPDGLPDPHKQKQTPTGWMQTATKLGIFSTLAAMNLQAAGNPAYDQGVQYMLTFHADGRFEIHATSDLGNHVQQVAAATTST